MWIVPYIILCACLAVPTSIVATIVVNRAITGVMRWCDRIWPPVPRDWRDEYAPKCERCGFDLRESSECCPECGKEMSGYDRTIAWHMRRLRDVDTPIERLHARALERHGEIAAMNRMRH